MRSGSYDFYLVLKVPVKSKTPLLPAWARLVSRAPAFSPLILIAGLVQAFQGVTFDGRSRGVRAIAYALHLPIIRAYWIFLLTEIFKARTRVQFASILCGSGVYWLRKPILTLFSEHISFYGGNRRQIFVITASALHHFIAAAPGLAEFGIENLAIIQPSTSLGPFGDVHFYDTLSTFARRGISTIAADSRSVAIHISRSFTPGTLLITRMDALPRNSDSYVIAPLLGRPAAFPYGLVRIAQRFKADIVPIHVGEDTNSINIRIGTPVKFDEEMSIENISDAVSDIHHQVGSMILEDPSHYGSWHLISEKWAKAEELLELSGEKQEENNG